VQPYEDRSCRRKSGSEGSKRGLALKAAAGTAAVAVLLALVTSACGGTTPSQSSSSVTQSHRLQKVTSTLDGETTIPLRTRWIAIPQPVGAPVAEVDFLIDGKLIWSEDAAAYVFDWRRQWHQSRLPDHHLAFARRAHFHRSCHGCCR